MSGFFTGMGGGLASGALSLAGSMISASQAGKQAREAEEFSQYMRSTAHQVEVQDLKKAGLNPVLSAGGGGASPGPGFQAPVPDYGKSLSSGVSSGAMMASVRKENQLKDVEIGLRKGMVKWLNSNPQYKDVFYGMMAANRAGVTGDKMLAFMGVNSAIRSGLVGRLRDWMEYAVDRYWTNPESYEEATLSPEDIQGLGRRHGFEPIELEALFKKHHGKRKGGE